MAIFFICMREIAQFRAEIKKVVEEALAPHIDEEKNKLYLKSVSMPWKRWVTLA